MKCTKLGDLDFQGHENSQKCVIVDVDGDEVHWSVIYWFICSSKRDCNDTCISGYQRLENIIWVAIVADVIEQDKIHDPYTPARHV